MAAVKSSIDSTTTSSDIKRLGELVQLFDHGPLGSETWAMLNPENTIFHIVENWNRVSTSLLTKSGNSPNTRFGKSKIPEWAEPMPDLEDNLGDAGNLVMLSDAIVDLRINANESVRKEWVPFMRRNMDFMSNVGEICKDRRPTPVYVSPPRKQFDRSIVAELGNEGLGATKYAINSARGELDRFNIDIEQLEEAIHIVVDSEIRKARSPYPFAH